MRLSPHSGVREWGTNVRDLKTGSHVDLYVFQRARTGCEDTKRYRANLTRLVQRARARFCADVILDVARVCFHDAGQLVRGLAAFPIVRKTFG